MRRGLTLAVEYHPQPLDLEAWVRMYVGKVLQNEGIAVTQPLNNPAPLAEAS